MKKILLSLGTLAAVAAPVAAVVACGSNTDNENHAPADSSSPMETDQTKELGAALGDGVEVSNAKKDVTDKDGTFKFTPSVDTEVSGITLKAGTEAVLKYTYTRDESGNPVLGDLQVNGQILNNGITDGMNSFLTNMIDWNGHKDKLQQEQAELDNQKAADTKKLNTIKKELEDREATVFTNLKADGKLKYKTPEEIAKIKAELSGHTAEDQKGQWAQDEIIDAIGTRVENEFQEADDVQKAKVKAKTDFENWETNARGKLNPKKMLQDNIDRIETKLDAIKQDDDRKSINDEITADTVEPTVFSPTVKDQLDGGWVITTDSGIELYLENGRKDTSVSFTDMSSVKQVTTEYKVTKAAVSGSNSTAPEISVFINGTQQPKPLDNSKYNQNINIDDASGSKPTDLVLRDVSGTYFAKGQGIIGTSFDKGVVAWGKPNSYVLNFLKFNLEDEIDENTPLQNLENKIRGMMFPGVSNPADKIGSHDSSSPAHFGFVNIIVNKTTGKLESFEISGDSDKWGKKA